MDVDHEQQQQPRGDVTRLLQQWAAGDARALEQLWPLVYEDVRRLARRQMARERGDHTLQGTALVNEAFIRLAGQRVLEWQNREQFLSLAAQIMRRVLVDHARQRGAQRRGDGAERVSLHDTQAAFEVDAAQALDHFEDDRVDVLAIDAALTRLQQIDAPQGRIVELRYFGGLTLEETASVTGVSLATVKREWAMARAWLRRELTTAEG
ncbi:MAG TPA: sigma-70 family RNA polymerase sigma factor [Steroidobacteraceae bacterium]|nr:sigma-70 family RNA polymerase sigma factor [Steroidobacteraceae bacterium]